MIKILIVDDSSITRALLLQILRKNPEFQVIGMAFNGNDAVALTKLHNPDVIIMDINMPEMDGFEATQRIRSGECGLDKAGIPILGLTARALQDSCDQAIAIGMNALLTKPFQPQDLLNKIYEWIKPNSEWIEK